MFGIKSERQTLWYPSEENESSAEKYTLKIIESDSQESTNIAVVLPQRTVSAVFVLCFAMDADHD